MHNERNKAEQEHFSQKKIQENVFLLNWKAHATIQALLKEKKIYLKKSLTTVLHLAIQLFSNKKWNNMSSDSELSAFSESSNDDEDIDVPEEEMKTLKLCLANTRHIILQSRSLVRNTTLSGHAIQRPFLTAKLHNFQAL